MLILVHIDLSKTEMSTFESYEAQVLSLLGRYGGRIVERLRSLDATTEVHLLDFPDANALEAFRADPTRAALQELWLSTGASSNLTEVRRLDLP